MAGKTLDETGLAELWSLVKSKDMMEKLIDVTTTEVADQVDLDVSGIDLTKYIGLVIYGVAKSTDISADYDLYVRLNGDSNSSYMGGTYGTTSAFDNSSLKTYLNNIKIPGSYSGEENYCNGHFLLRMTFSEAMLGGGALVLSQGFAVRFYRALGGAAYTTLGVNKPTLSNLSTIQTINLVSHQMQAGSRFILYGIKK